MLRVAIVGSGEIARAHARACREVAEAELVAAYDVQAQAADKLADEFGVPGRYTDLSAMLENEDVDIAVIATWGPSHAELTCALAESGRVRAILCEKPFSRNAAEAETMCDAAEANDVLLAEGLKFRHHPVHLKARELMRDGRIGTVSYVRSNYVDFKPPAERHPGSNWRFDPQRGGGVVFDKACYCIYHARFVMESEPELVSAIGSWGSRSMVDELAVGNMIFPGDRGAQWWASIDSTPSFMAEIYGTEGMIHIDGAFSDVSTLHLRDSEGNKESYQFSVNQFALQLQHMCDCLNTSRAHRIPARQSVAQMRTIDAVFESLRTGAAVEVGKQGQDPGTVQPTGPNPAQRPDTGASA
jgi:predicted dehydrogenase